MLIPFPIKIKIPVINVKSIMLAPKIFPRLNEEAFEIAAEIPTNNSGEEVAIAIIINAAENSEILRNLAILCKDLTRITAETIIPAAAIIKNTKF